MDVLPLTLLARCAALTVIQANPLSAQHAQSLAPFENGPFCEEVAERGHDGTSNAPRGPDPTWPFLCSFQASQLPAFVG